MNTPFDLFSGMKGNEFIDLLAENFRLQQDQAEKAFAALVPAFSEGLKRKTRAPEGAGEFLQNLASVDWLKYAQNPAVAFSPDGIRQGQELLAKWLGGQDLTNAIAAQAATMSGLSSNVMQQMMPHLAPFIMAGIQNRMFTPPGMQAGAGISKGATAFADFLQSAQNTQAKFAEAQMAMVSETPFGRILEEMLRQQTGRTGGGKAYNPFENTPWGDILDQMMGNNRPSTPDLKEMPNPFNPENNPLGRIFQEMLKGGQSEPEQSSEPEDDGQNRQANEDPDPYAAPKSGFEDLFSEMFKTGRQVNEGYEAAIRGMFDKFGPSTDKPGKS